MQLPRVRLSVEWVDIPLRFSMRHLMIAVAIVALALGLAMIARRRGQYLRLANYQAISAQATVSYQDYLTGLADRAEEEAKTTPSKRVQWFPPDGQPVVSLTLAEHAEQTRGRASYWSRVVSYHEGLRQKYTEAASKPWQFIPSDPPPPSDPLLP